MKILKSEEFINEAYSGKANVFAFKDVSANADDRDCVSYVEIINGKIHTDVTGQIIIMGPCYSSRLDKNANYKNYETVLNEEQFNAFKERTCSDEMLEQIANALCSKENEELVEKVKNDELETIAGMCGVSKADAEDIVDDYPLGNGYFDRGICSCYDNFFEELIWEFGSEEWLVDFLWDNNNNDELEEYFEVAKDSGSGVTYDKLVELGYDFDSIDVEDLANRYKRLDNGKVIEYYM